MKLLKRGTLPIEYVGVPLPEIKVSWRQSKQGKRQSKAERDLSLNLIEQPLQQNGCLICMVEAAEGSWKRLGPLWVTFHKMGLSRRALGQKRFMIVMYNGRKTASDRIVMQHFW
jgi:hypothetical protein